MTENKTVVISVLVSDGLNSFEYIITEENSSLYTIGDSSRYSLQISNSFLLSLLINLKIETSTENLSYSFDLCQDMDTISVSIVDRYAKNICIQSHKDVVSLNSLSVQSNFVIAEKLNINTMLVHSLGTLEVVNLKECSVGKVLSQGIFNVVKDSKLYEPTILVESSEIDLMKLIKSHRLISIENSKIDNLEIYDDFHSINDIESKYTNVIKHLKIVGVNNAIKSFISDAIISELTIMKCNFDLIAFSDKSKWINCNVRSAIFKECLYATEMNFNLMNEFTWELVIESYKAVRDDKNLVEAHYKYELLRSKKYHLVTRLFMRASSGFGYKPSNALLSIPLLVIIFAIGYTAIDMTVLSDQGYVWDLTKSGRETVLDLFQERIYYSGITFTTTGYGEVGLTSKWIRIVSFFEACLGVSFLSMFVYSLTKKHLK